MKNITDRILGSHHSSVELEAFFVTRGSASQVDQRTIAYEDGRLIVEYKTNHQISSICVDDNYSESMIRDLELEVNEALAQGETIVAQRYLHSLYRTEGYYRHEDMFQIISSPPDAPQPEFGYAQHSFLLEFSFTTSSNSYVNNHRLNKRFSELSLLLHAILQSVVIPKASASHEWVITRDSEPTSHYMQLGYIGGNQHRTKLADGFSSKEGLQQIEFEDSQEYYSRLGVDLKKPLNFPSTFVDSIAAYDGLDNESKSKFLRASFWSHVSSRIFEVSQSASFAALVSAIEVFLLEPIERCGECGRPTSSDRCEVCNQPIAGPTKHFREFVELYAPGVPARDRNRLYNRRSSLSHGSSLLPSDLAEIWFTPRLNEAWKERQLLTQIVQRVLVNWLNSPK